MAEVTQAEAAAAALTIAPAAVVLTVYLVDRAGGPITPWPMLVVGVVSGIVTVAALRPRSADSARADTIAWLTLVAAFFAWLLWIARPDFLPLGRGTDLTHHLLLIDWIERHRALVHDRAVGLWMGEMALYTPGSHILAAVAGAWARSNGTHLLHPLMAGAVALKVGFVYLIARRSLPEAVPRVPIACAAALTHLASLTFFLGSFTEFSFYAQVIAEWFAVGMWWAVTAWFQNGQRRLLVVSGVMGATAFLTWPVVMGPPVVMLALLVLVRGKAGLRQRSLESLLALLPIAIVALLFSSGRTDMAIIVGTSGKATTPALAMYGWPFLIVSVAGLLSAPFREHSRPAALFACALALQMVALWAFARWHSNVPYMALKMWYLALSVQSVAVAIAIGTVWRFIAGLTPISRPAGERAAWALAIVIALLLIRPLTRAHVPFVTDRQPAVTLSIEQAGLWARANLPVDCFEYLIANDDSAYWLHLAVLGNPRLTSRTAEPGSFERTPNIVRWLTPGGRTYAIADLPALPASVRDELDIVQQFGTAAIARRRGVSSCPSGR